MSKLVSEMQEIRNRIDVLVRRHKGGDDLRHQARDEAQALIQEDGNDLTPRQIARIAVTRGLE